MSASATRTAWLRALVLTLGSLLQANELPAQTAPRVAGVHGSYSLRGRPGIHPNRLAGGDTLRVHGGSAILLEYTNALLVPEPGRESDRLAALVVGVPSGTVFEVPAELDLDVVSRLGLEARFVLSEQGLEAVLSGLVEDAAAPIVAFIVMAGERVVAAAAARTWVLEPKYPHPDSLTSLGRAPAGPASTAASDTVCIGCGAVSDTVSVGVPSAASTGSGRAAERLPSTLEGRWGFSLLGIDGTLGLADLGDATQVRLDWSGTTGEGGSVRLALPYLSFAFRGQTFLGRFEGVDAILGIRDDADTREVVTWMGWR